MNKDIRENARLLSAQQRNANNIDANVFLWFTIFIHKTVFPVKFCP